MNTTFKGAIKDDLKQITSELNINAQENNTKFEIIQLIKTQTNTKKEPDSVKDMVNLIIEERKSQS